MNVYLIIIFRDKERITVATKSICKDIRIKNRGLVRGLVSALENAKGKSSKDVELKKMVEEVKAEDIKKYFEV